MIVEAGKGCLRRNIPSAKHNEDQYVPPDIQGDVLEVSIDKYMHYERIGKMRARKYLKKGYCHCIKCSATNFLAALIWRRLLNSATLATTMHRKPKRVSDRTGTQVRAQMVNKYRIKMIQKELYNVRDLP